MSVERVEINEPVAGEQMTLEDQLAKQEAEGIGQVMEEPTQQEPSGQEDNVAEESVEEKPEWLPEKFKTPEDLAKAYTELEKERGKESQPNKEEKGEVTGESPDVSKAIQNASDAFFSDAGMTEENYKSLEEAGVPREFAEAYVKGQEASLEVAASAIRDSVGGKENYDAMIEWASSSLPASEIDSFDEIVSGGSKDTANMAVKGLYARYLSEGGGSPVNIAKGGTSKAAIQPFNSNAQVVEAINDRRYQIDPAYRAEVEKRISVSPNI
jgi:hypothetical protein